MASCTCHAVCGATRVRLERIVRPLAGELIFSKYTDIERISRPLPCRKYLFELPEFQVDSLAMRMGEIVYLHRVMRKSYCWKWRAGERRERAPRSNHPACARNHHGMPASIGS